MGKLALALAVMMVPAAASAQDVFGAIAFGDETGTMALVNNAPSRASAEQSALRGCARTASDCEISIWFSNGCGAIALSSDAWGAAGGDDLEEAEARAVFECELNTNRTCRVQASTCTVNLN